MCNVGDLRGVKIRHYPLAFGLDILKFVLPRCAAEEVLYLVMIHRLFSPKSPSSLRSLCPSYFRLNIPKGIAGHRAFGLNSLRRTPLYISFMLYPVQGLHDYSDATVQLSDQLPHRAFQRENNSRASTWLHLPTTASNTGQNRSLPDNYNRALTSGPATVTDLLVLKRYG